MVWVRMDWAIDILQAKKEQNNYNAGLRIRYFHPFSFTNFLSNQKESNAKLRINLSPEISNFLLVLRL